MMNGNIINFKGKSNNREVDSQIVQSILTLQNFHHTYCETLERLMKHVNSLGESEKLISQQEINLLQQHIEIIEEQISSLLYLVKSE